MLSQLIETTLAAGRTILDIYDTGFDVETKADNSPLTTADRAAHVLICERLAALAGYPILSEESAEVPTPERRQWGTFWLVDPLDGTKEFVKRNGEFTVNIALIEGDVAVLGLVYAPVLDALYIGGVRPESEPITAEILHGAATDSVRVTEASTQDFSNMNTLADVLTLETAIALPGERVNGGLRVVASKSHCNDETLAYIQAEEERFGPADRVARGSSLKLCMIAESAADVYPRLAPTMEWDTAAAQAVVEGAGGVVRGRLEDAAGDDVWQRMPYNKETLLQKGFIVESRWYLNQIDALA